MSKVFSLKGLFCLLIAVASLSFFSCAKEVLPTRMEQFYSESRGLSEVSIDSIKTFTTKFSSFVGSYPESRQDKLFNPTLDNIRNAAAIYGYKLVEVKVGFTINDEWDGETNIYF